MARSRAAMTAAVAAPPRPQAGAASAKASGALSSRRWRAPPDTCAPPPSGAVRLRARAPSVAATASSKSSVRDVP
eukprot:3772052-Pleurochrysis_carterae.AAC.1